MRLVTVHVVICRDHGCPEEGMPGSDEIAFIAGTEAEAHAFIAERKQAADWRWCNMHVEGRDALMGVQARVVLVDALELGAQPLWKMR